MTNHNTQSMLPICIGLPCLILSGADISTNNYFQQGTSITHEISSLDFMNNREGLQRPADVVDKFFFQDYYLCGKITPQNNSSIYMIKNNLPSFLSISDERKVLEFIDENPNTLVAIKSTISRIKQNFDPEAILELSLYDEGENWKTLFIEINTKKTWDEIKVFREYEWDHLFRDHNEVYKILNLQFC